MSDSVDWGPIVKPFLDRIFAGEPPSEGADRIDPPAVFDQAAHAKYPPSENGTWPIGMEPPPFAEFPWRRP